MCPEIVPNIGKCVVFARPFDWENMCVCVRVRTVGGVLFVVAYLQYLQNICTIVRFHLSARIAEKSIQNGVRVVAKSYANICVCVRGRAIC